MSEALGTLATVIVILALAGRSLVNNLSVIIHELLDGIKEQTESINKLYLLQKDQLAHDKINANNQENNHTYLSEQLDRIEKKVDSGLNRIKEIETWIL